MYAHNSSTVISLHLAYFSSPMHSQAYLLLCSTISSSNVGVLKRKKIFGVRGIVTTVIEVRCSVQEMFSELYALQHTNSRFSVYAHVRVHAHVPWNAHSQCHVHAHAYMHAHTPMCLQTGAHCLLTSHLTGSVIFRLVNQQQECQQSHPCTCTHTHTHIVHTPHMFRYSVIIRLVRATIRNFVAVLSVTVTSRTGVPIPYLCAYLSSSGTSSSKPSSSSKKGKK